PKHVCGPSRCTHINGVEEVVSPIANVRDSLSEFCNQGTLAHPGIAPYSKHSGIGFSAADRFEELHDCSLRLFSAYKVLGPSGSVVSPAFSVLDLHDSLEAWHIG